MTDAQIGGPSKLNGERTLEKWMPDGDEDHDASLDLDGGFGGGGESNGWNAEDMFKANEQNLGVTSSYKSNLEGYTQQIEMDKDSAKYRYLYLIFK